METRSLLHTDVDAMWAINEQGLPGTGAISRQGLADLLDLSVFSIGAFSSDELVGFVVCLLPRTAYGSLNYAWFNERFDAFIYVDRIAVAPSQRNQGVGSRLYDEVITYAQEHGRFHHRFGFKESGVLQHGEKAVTMLLRKASIDTEIDMIDGLIGMRFSTNSSTIIRILGWRDRFSKK